MTRHEAVMRETMRAVFQGQRVLIIVPNVGALAHTRESVVAAAERYRLQYKVSRNDREISFASGGKVVLRNASEAEQTVRAHERVDLFDTHERAAVAVAKVARANAHLRMAAVAPSSAIGRLTLDELGRACERAGIPFDARFQTGEVVVGGAARITFAVADNPHRLEGLRFNGYWYIAPQIWRGGEEIYEMIENRAAGEMIEGALIESIG